MRIVEARTLKLTYVEPNTLRLTTSINGRQQENDENVGYAHRETHALCGRAYKKQRPIIY